MMRTWGLLSVVFLVLVLVGCTQPDMQKSESETEQILPEEGYIFVSDAQKQHWRNDLIARLDSLDIRDVEGAVAGSFAVGLMDLNCDGTPEVIAAYPGGSMGNVFLEIYDLKTGQECTAFNAGHYESSRNICMHVADCGGEYMIITQGVLRNHDIGWLDLVGVIDTQFEQEYPFGHTKGEAAVYYYRGELVDNEEYLAQYKQFFRDHKVLQSTGIQLVQWDSLEGQDRATLVQSMADALLGSSQTFIDFSQ